MFHPCHGAGVVFGRHVVAAVVSRARIVLVDIRGFRKFWIGCELVCPFEVLRATYHVLREPPFYHDRYTLRCIERGRIVSMVDGDGLRIAELGEHDQE